MSIHQKSQTYPDKVKCKSCTCVTLYGIYRRGGVFIWTWLQFSLSLTLSTARGWKQHAFTDSYSWCSLISGRAGAAPYSFRAHTHTHTHFSRQVKWISDCWSIGLCSASSLLMTMCFSASCSLCGVPKGQWAHRCLQCLADIITSHHLN